jgi:gliding motility-associated-like protein
MSRTKKILATLAFTLAAVSFSNAQNLCLGNDTSICLGQPVTVEDCNPGTAAGLLMNNATFITLTDDSYSPAVNIGFPFSFYGTNYNQCVIGSNGVVSFDLTNANGYCAWALNGTPLPSATVNEANNAIMPAYHDINPSAFASPNGEIMYQTFGTAPNRQFVILYKDILAFGGGGECTYMGLILNETSNVIELHLGFKPIATGWNGGLAIQGVQNAPGTVASTTAGRNNTQWNAVNDTKIYTPVSPTNTSSYTVSNGIYLQIVSPNSTYVWENTLGQTFPYNNGILNIPTPPPGTTGYYLALSAASCNNSVGAASDTTFITATSATVTATSTPDICTSGQGTVTATPGAGTAPFTYDWTTLGNNPNANVTNVLAGLHTVVITDALGCTGTANILVDDTPAVFQGSTTLVSCAGGANGTAFAEMVPALGTITYQWDDPLAQTTQTAVGLTAGQYTCTITSTIGCMGTVVLDVVEIPALTAVISAQSDVTCNSSNDGMITLDVTQGTGPYTYTWYNSASTTNIANDLYVGPHQITVTDANGCIVVVNGVLNEPPALDINFVTPNTQICPEDDITLNVTGIGGSSPYTFTWSQGGTVIGTGDQITVDPLVTNTEYCVTLSEACGSPTDQECIMITFPTPIVPNAVPDMYEKCVPNPFEFDNTSSNGGEIATAYWDFGSDEYITLETGNDSTSFFFDDVGQYDLIMTVTSIYGCVYTDTIVNIMQVLPSPTADFFFSSNPATIFETTTFMQDKSSQDVVNWEWDSPFSSPTSSNLITPTFVFPDGEVGQYPVTLMVETELGCRDTITYIMNVVEDVLFYAPNTFTPDGDEFNQTWKVEVAGIDEFNFELIIFNRWGEIIWESRDPNIGWDGTYGGIPVQDGTYAWVARVAVPYNDDKLEYNGSINLIR